MYVDAVSIMQVDPEDGMLTLTLINGHWVAPSTFTRGQVHE